MKVIGRPYNLDGRIIPIFIDAEALAGWEANRERLKRNGYPDRPPDVDTPTTRAWRMHPGDEGYDTQQREIPENPYESLSVAVPDQLGVKFLVNQTDDGLVVRVRFEKRDGTWSTHGEKLTTPESWEIAKAEFIAEAKRMGATDEMIMLTTKADFDDITNQFAEIDAAIREWYAGDLDVRWET